MADSIVLGIHWEQNSGAALFINGELANALSQERCSRKKNDERYPYEAIERILKDNNVKKEQITQVAVASKHWNPEYTLNRHYSAKTVRDHIEEQYKYWKPRLVEGLDVDYLEINKDTLDLEQYPGKDFWQKVIKESNDYNDEEAKEQYYKGVRMQVIQAHLGDKKIIEVEHTACHAAASILFNENNFKKAAVVTMDGWGDGVNHSIRILSKNEEAYEIELLMKKGTSDIARIYRYTTLLLGMKPNEHEYKIMGLAPYANKEYINDTLMKLKGMARVNGIYIEKQGENKDIYFHLKNCFEGQRFDNIAGGLQEFVEGILAEWFTNISKLGVDHIIYSGGVAMNVKSNMVLRKLLKKRKIGFSVPLAPDDTSQCIGAAYSVITGMDKKHEERSIKLNLGITNKPPSAYLGVQSCNIEKRIMENKLENEYEVEKYDIDSVVRGLENGKIFARWNGSEEFGARALGNRSVIADPSKIENIERINSTIKSRDFWMPFACTILDKWAKIYLKIEGDIEDYKYMTMCAETNEEHRWRIKAGTHPQDGTCRPQVLMFEDNKSYYQLIERFGEKTGIYSLLNTSLNIHGMPIASTLDDAIDVLIKGKLDGLLVGDSIMISKKDKNS